MRAGRTSFLLFFLLLSAACRSAPAPSAPAPVTRAAEGVVTFRYLPPSLAPEITSISVPGTFNDWGTNALPMERQADGSWRATLELEPGRYEYKFLINGIWPSDMCDDRTWGDPRHGFRIDPGADGCVPDGNTGRNALLVIGGTVEAAGGSGFAHDPARAADLSAAGDQLSVRFQHGRGQVRSASVTADGESFPMHLQLSYGSREVWRGAVPEGTRSYSLEVDAGEGRREFGPYAVPADLFRAVPWVGDAVGYQIFPERFWNGDPGNDEQALATSAYRYMHPDHWGAAGPPVLMREWGGEVMDFHCCHQYFGGDLQGILDRLDHLQSLGVTLIYLNPIFLAGSAHGYDTFDYLRVAPNLGDEPLLRRLLEQARARGMRVMWDFVPNHVGVGHHAFQDAVRSGEASPYWSWFRFRVPAEQVEVGNGEHYGAWSGFGSLPELETRNPEVLQHLLEVTRHWTAFGFAGIRVDVPNEIVNRKEFFRAFRLAARTIDPEVYLVGEIWRRSPSWLQGDEFDSLMNYAIGREVIERFATGGTTGGGAAEEMAQLYAEYPEASVAMQFNLISSHDTPRLLTRMGGGELGGTPGAAALARQRLASAILYALPGMPVTFQGDECAFLGGGPPREENRYPVQWHACDGTMLAHYRQLARLRRELPALRSPVLRSPRGEGSLLSFHRGEPGAGELLALFNSAPESRSLILPAGSWRDALSDEVMSGSAEVGAHGWRYLQRR